MKLGILSPVLPPAQSGQAIALYRLLDGVNPDQYILISPTDYNRVTGGKDTCSQKLSGKYYHLPHSHAKLVHWLLKLNHYHGGIFNIYLNARINRIITLLKAEKCSHVVACTADLVDPYCAYEAAKKLGIPFFLYMFDDYIQQWTNGYHHDFARRVGPVIIKNAKGIIVPNEHLKKFCDNNYDVDSIVIHNPVNISDYSGQPSELDYSSGSEITIVYTGAIYEAQSDALNRLRDAISIIKKKKVKLHIFSPNSWAPEKSPDGCIVYHDPLPIERMPEVQMNAHILFLPLAFKSPYPESLINTSSPGKIGEYLASGRPIIVHSPPDSFVTWYFRNYECGGVVDSIDEHILSAEITRIIDDENYRRLIMNNAIIRAKIDFDLTTIRNQFWEIFT